MNIGGYILNISPGQEQGDGRVNIAHMQQYAIIVGNVHDTRCKVRIELDGQHVGTWVLYPRQVNARIERPIDTNECFTAILARSEEASDANLGDVSRQELGLVQAIFMPEKKFHQTGLVYASNGDIRKNIYGTEEATRKMAMPGAAMGTGLSGHSDQQYGISDWFDVDDDARVTITLRLVDLSYGYAQPVPKVQPIRRANLIPPQGD